MALKPMNVRKNSGRTNILGGYDDGTAQFLKKIRRSKILDTDLEIELLKKIQNGADTSGEALKRIIEGHSRFLLEIAKEYYKKSRGSRLTLRDLFNEGVQGIIKATQEFDATKGFKFNSYAIWWIRQKMILAILEENNGPISKPHNRIVISGQVARISSELFTLLEREPTAEEIWEVLHEEEKKKKQESKGDPDKFIFSSIKEVKEVLSPQFRPTIDFDEPLSVESDITFHDVYGDSEFLDRLETDAHRAEMRDIVSWFLKKSGLNQKRRRTLELFFNIGDQEEFQLTLEAIAERLFEEKLTKRLYSIERIRQYKEEALVYLKKHHKLEELRKLVVMTKRED